MNLQKCTLAVTAVAMLVVAGCSKAPEAPKNAATGAQTDAASAPQAAKTAPNPKAEETKIVLQNFYVALGSQNYQGAFNLLTDAGKAALKVTKAEDLAGQKVKLVKTIMYDNVVMNGDNAADATVTVDVEVDAGSAYASGRNTRAIKLLKDNGAWKIDAVVAK